MDFWYDGVVSLPTYPQRLGRVLQTFDEEQKKKNKTKEGKGKRGSEVGRTILKIKLLGELRTQKSVGIYHVNTPSYWAVNFRTCDLSVRDGLKVSTESVTDSHTETLQ